MSGNVDIPAGDLVALHEEIGRLRTALKAAGTILYVLSEDGNVLPEDRADAKRVLAQIKDALK
jgi:hypothetical protein